MRRTVVLLGVALTSACSLIVDLSVLEGPAAEAGPADSSAQDAPSDGLPDAVEAASDASDGACTFFDDFNRTSDAGIIGNGWLTKQPGFVLANDAVDRVNQSSYDYRDLVVHRPTSEDLANVVTSVEVHYGPSVQGYPQLHARIQAATVDVPNTLDDYLFFPQGNSTTMIVARNNGTSSYTQLGAITLGAALDTLHTYRFTLSVQGSSPVNLSGMVERLDGTTWTLVGMVGAADTSAEQITSSGAAGFSGGSGDLTHQFTYDNFCVRAM